jgi:hypothetical protein
MTATREEIGGHFLIGSNFFRNVSVMELEAKILDAIEMNQFIGVMFNPHYMKKVDSLIFFASGWKRSGKDLFRSTLESHYDFNGLAFADTLRDRAMEDFDLTLEDFSDERKEKPLLQYPFRGDVNDIAADKNLFTFLRTEDGWKITDITECSDKKGVVLVSDGKSVKVLRFEEGNPILYYTPRLILIVIGTDARKIDPTIFVRKTFKRFLRICPINQPCVRS